MIEGLSASIASDKPSRAIVLSRPSPPAKRLPTFTVSISGAITSCQMTGDLRARDVAQHRPFDPTAIRRETAARVERAARWQVAQQRREAGDACERAARF